MNALVATESERTPSTRWPSSTVDQNGFDFSDLQVFDTIPRYNHDVVPMHGLVIVFDKLAFRYEGFIEGKLYVRENQRPAANLRYDSWLDLEREYGQPAGPSSPLVTHREVVRYVTHAPTGLPALRMDSRFVDGPYQEWAFGRNLVGKVVGIYRPGGAA